MIMIMIMIIIGIVHWWRELGSGLQAVIIAVPAVVFIAIIALCGCCCCGCCDSSKPSAGRTTVVVPGPQPNLAIMTTTSNHVPMKPIC